eukprot:8829366-Pyramimonas_sp.AAC.1
MLTTLNLHLTYAHHPPDSKSGIIAKKRRTRRNGRVTATATCITSERHQGVARIRCAHVAGRDRSLDPSPGRCRRLLRWQLNHASSRSRRLSR